MILVVGGAGYIGSHMCKLLREWGLSHVVFDSLEKGHREAAAGSELVLGDLNDRAALDALFSTHRIDQVMHFAAYIEVGESVREPAKYYRNNFIGVWNLLEAMRAANVMQLVFSSTAAIFGEPEYTPIDEQHPKRPTSPYGQSKFMVERMLADYERAYDLRSVCLRYFNAAGCDPDGELGEDHDPETHLIPAAILATLGRRAPLQVFGTDYPTPDGTCVRDYIHVSDLAHAHLLALEYLSKNGRSIQYNLGNGRGFSVLQVLHSIELAAGKSVPRENGPRRPGDPAILVASSQAISQAWGWKPEHPSLDEMVSHAWRWLSSHPTGY